jgi:hypothetical protein
LLLKRQNQIEIVVVLFGIISIDMDDTYDPDKSPSDTIDDAALYMDCIRLVEGGHVRRFENAAAKFDVVQYELNNGPSKSLLFYAIEHNVEAFVKILLDMEIPLDKKYSVRMFFFSVSLLGQYVYLVNKC